MIIRNIDSVQTVDWGNGRSARFLVEKDGLGYTVADTTVRAGTKSRLEYARHLEACYCIGGSGEVVEMDGTTHRLEPGTLYALNQNDPHYLIADPDVDLHLVSMFSPALQGHEVHSLDSDGFSQY